MIRETHLKNAPIQEALIDIRVELEADGKIDKFLSLARDLKPEFPTHRPTRLLEAQIRLDAGTPPAGETTEVHRGLTLRSASGEELVQFRTDGFTFNRLRPYTSWDDIFPKAWALWERYAEIAEPTAIPRLAVRYINSFQTAARHWESFLHFKPKLPKQLPTKLGNALVRVTLNEPNSEIGVNLTESVQVDSSADHAKLVLDIDVYQLGQFESEPRRIVETFDDLRKVKNKIFFNSVTERAVRSFG